MARVRRSTYVLYYIQDTPFLDIPALLRGSATLERNRQIYALSVIGGDAFPITWDELRILHSIPSDRWVPETEINLNREPQALSCFCERGLLLSDSDDAHLAQLRNRHETLSTLQWHLLASVYHYLTRWEDVRMGDRPDRPEDVVRTIGVKQNVLEEILEKHGPPPSHFHSVPPGSKVHELPFVDRKGALYEVLRRRKTTRGFDRNTPLSHENFATILECVYGCHGYAPVIEGVVGLKKTSPSGGGLHPVEVYPLVINVDGLDPGLYHYRVETHAVEEMELLKRAEAEELANRMTIGQGYPRFAQALFVMTARFYRNYWKYRKHPRAYAVILMDVGHLSQTFYLVCTELGLGSFVSAAINGVDIDERLGLDGLEEGAIAICGCGSPLGRDVGLEPTFLPYVPRRTRI